jgi:ribosomal protein S17E
LEEPAIIVFKDILGIIWGYFTRAINCDNKAKNAVWGYIAKAVMVIKRTP